MANITYTQEDDTATPGIITLDSQSMTAVSGPPNQGRLDNVGDLVFAEFIRKFGSKVRVECIRTSNDEMTIRVIATNPTNKWAYGDGYYSSHESVAQNVPINFK